MHTVKSTRLTLVIIAALAIASPALAQSRRNDRFAYGSDRVPPGHRPPAGMCRVWIDGVPPGHQPAPTDCATAYATRPANARVIYGSGDDAFPGKGNGKWKNARRSSGDVDRRGIYGTIFSPNQRGTIRRDGDDDDDRFDRRRGDDDDRFDNRRGDDDDDDRFENRRRGRDGIDRFDPRRVESSGKGKFKNKNKHEHKRKHEHEND
jgi:hypothetical protein